MPTQYSKITIYCEDSGSTTNTLINTDLHQRAHLINTNIHMTMTMTMKISLFDINHLNTMIRENKAEKNTLMNRRPYKTI